MDETRELTMATPPDTVGFVKYTALHDYDMVSRLLYDTLWLPSGYSVSFIKKVPNTNHGTEADYPHEGFS